MGLALQELLQSAVERSDGEHEAEPAQPMDAAAEEVSQLLSQMTLDRLLDTVNKEVRLAQHLLLAAQCQEILPTSNPSE